MTTFEFSKFCFSEMEEGKFYQMFGIFSAIVADDKEFKVSDLIASMQELQDERNMTLQELMEKNQK